MARRPLPLSRFAPEIEAFKKDLVEKGMRQEPSDTRYAGGLVFVAAGHFGHFFIELPVIPRPRPSHN
jgi:hypothetical protein